MPYRRAFFLIESVYWRNGGTNGVTAHQPNGVVLKMDEVQPVESYRAGTLIGR